MRICLITGNDTVNQAVVILLTTSMAVGGVIAFILDNAFPGMSARNTVSRVNVKL